MSPCWLAVRPGNLSRVLVVWIFWGAHRRDSDKVRHLTVGLDRTMQTEFWTARKVALAGVGIGAVWQMPADPVLWWTAEGIGMMLAGALIGGLIGAALGKLLPAEKRNA